MVSSPSAATSNPTSGDPSVATRVYRFTVGDDDAGRRLDRYLTDRDAPSMSRSQVKKYIDRGEVSVNGDNVKAGHRLRAGDRIRWDHSPPKTPTVAPQPIDFDVLYDDDEMAIVDKPAGLVVHPAPGHPDHTLVNGLSHRFEQLSSEGGELRPGIVHRLDRDTSGSLAIAKTDRAHRHLAAQFRDHTAQRRYHALVHGPGLDDEGTFDTGHQRHPRHRTRFTGTTDSPPRRAITHYRVLERFESGACLVECELETGRTHQIRMHFYEANAPVIGDRTYGGRSTGNASIIDRQALHALSLGVEHPDGFLIRRNAPYPDDFRSALDALQRGADWR